MLLVAMAIVFSRRELISAQSTIQNDESAAKVRVLIVIGAPGLEEYKEPFRRSASIWQRQFKPSEITLLDGSIDPPSGEDSKDGKSNESNSLSSNPSDKEKILQWIDRFQSTEGADSYSTNWIILIGHGTNDRSGAKFNLRGPDIGATEIAKLLSPKQKWIFIDCSSSSAPFLTALSAPNRVVITSTKSGAEQNYSRFGEFLASAIEDIENDLDHDSSISLLEAFIGASNHVSRFYKEEGRLASEQALIDDNDDRKGTPASFFKGTRPAKAPSQGLELDGSLARQIIIHRFESPQANFDVTKTELVATLELKLESLRTNKLKWPEDEYYQKMELLLLELASCLESKTQPNDTESP